MYVHDDSETTEDSFTLRLSDGRHQLDREVTVRVVPVNDQEPRLMRLAPGTFLRGVKSLALWQPTAWSPRRNSGVEVEPGEARLISSAVLLAQDADTPSAGVRYKIQNVPTQGLLQLKVRA